MANREKLKHLILYIAKSFEGAEHFGSTKLNKALYNAEAACYLELGRPLTGFFYQKNFRGPTLRAFLPVLQEMQEELRVLVRYTDKDEERVEAVDMPDLEMFTEKQRQIIDRELDAIRHLTARQTMDRSHQTAAWYATKLGETIPWDLALVEDPDTIGPPADHDTWANHVIDQHLRRSSRA